MAERIGKAFKDYATYIAIAIAAVTAGVGAHADMQARLREADRRLEKIEATLDAHGQILLTIRLQLATLAK